jgi:serine dehydrogenase proteinase
VRVAWAAWVQGLPVSTDMPRAVYDLMDLYPQGAKGRPSVLHVPFRRGWLESLPLLPSLLP